MNAGVVGKPAYCGHGSELDGIAGELAQSTATQQHAGRKSRGAGHGRALRILVGL
jgi:hypothetical protein